VYFPNRTLTAGGSLAAEPLPASRIQEPASELQTLTPARNLNASTPCSSVLSAPSVLKKPRSKISRLPKPIQTNLNTMLASGCPYLLLRLIHSSTLNCAGLTRFTGESKRLQLFPTRVELCERRLGAREIAF